MNSLWEWTKTKNVERVGSSLKCWAIEEGHPNINGERESNVNANLCLLLNFISTWAMVGLIWLIQIVHYPLFSKVGEQQFREYSEDHQRLITYVVLPLMFVELGTTILLWFTRPQGISSAWILAGVALVLLIWGSTFLIQVPQHGKLLSGYDAGVCRQLVIGNWIRTVAWSLRGLITAWMVWRVMSVSA